MIVLHGPRLVWCDPGVKGGWALCEQLGWHWKDSDSVCYVVVSCEAGKDGAARIQTSLMGLCCMRRFVKRGRMVLKGLRLLWCDPGVWGGWVMCEHHRCCIWRCNKVLQGLIILWCGLRPILWDPGGSDSWVGFRPSYVTSKDKIILEKYNFFYFKLNKIYSVNV